MKANKSIDSLSPGPGAYDANSSLERRGAVTPRAARFSYRGELSPGPGSHSSSFLTPKNSGSGFGTSRRKEVFKPTESPGPGSYDYSSTCFTGPSFSFPHKKSNTKLPNTPGPGAYSYRFITKHPTAVTIGNAKRPDIMRISISPGPGRYDCNVSKVRNTSPSWSIHGIKDPSFTKDTPGPGKYDIYSTKSPKGFISTKSTRVPLFQGTKSPGPGRYEPKDIKSPKIRYSIGKAKRPNIVNNSPGPGKYESKVLTKSVSAQFGTGPKKTLQVVTETANASLVLLKPMDKAPAYTFGKKYTVKDDNGVPGPGAYNTEKKLNSPRIKIGSGFRFIKSYAEKDEVDKPGPGAYEIKADGFTAKVYISKAKKEVSKTSETPGPGRYNLA